MRTSHSSLNSCVLFAWAFAITGMLGIVRSQSPTNLIDASVSRELDALVGNPESDGLQLRRLSLDLRMVGPTTTELDEYFADQSPDRWARWVKRFLDDPLHRERMVEWLDKTLLQRRPNKYVDRTAWTTYLRKTVDEGKPIDAIVKEVITSVWWNGTQRPSQRFFLDREGDAHAIARDAGRIMFGRDMQCNQCHDHPNIDDYLQIDYHGLLAFFSPSALAEAKYKDDKGAEQKMQLYIERAAGDAPFESVFDKGVLFRTGTRIPGGKEQFEAYELPDQRYATTPTPDAYEGATKAPSVSRRGSLATQLTPDHQAFAENWSNRIWALMMGRGIVHPLDMHHADNPASNPELLAVLTQSLISSKYNVRSLIEQIAMSDVYQRSGQPAIASSLQHNCVLNVATEPVAKLMQVVAGKKQMVESQIPTWEANAKEANDSMGKAKTNWRAIQSERVVIRSDLDKAEAVYNDVKKKLDDSNMALDKVTKQWNDIVSRQKLFEEAVTKLEQAKAIVPTEEPDVAQAIAVTRAKSESTQAELSAIEKAKADAVAARDVLVSPVDVARARLNEIVAQMQPVEQRLGAADQVFLDARFGWRKAQQAHLLATKSLSCLKHIQDWTTASEQVSQSEQAYLLAVDAKSQKMVFHASILAQLTQVQQLVSEANKITEAINLKRGLFEQQQSSIEAEIADLKSAIDSLNKSAPLVQSPDAISAAKEAIESSITVKQIAMTAIQGEIQLNIQEGDRQAIVVTGLAAERATIEPVLASATLAVEQAAEAIAAADQARQQSIEKSAIEMQRVLIDRQSEFQLAQDRILSPEQLGLSTLQATHVLGNYVSNELVELEKQSPLAADASQDQRDARKLQATRQAIDKLRGNIDVFANLYSSGVGQTSDEFFASPDQALYMANGGSVFNWAAPSGSNPAGLAIQQTDPQQGAIAMYRSLLARDPSESEKRWVAEQLTLAPDQKPIVGQELVWGILTSSEFRVYP
jgi:hypothetical protein